MLIEFIKRGIHTLMCLKYGLSKNKFEANRVEYLWNRDLARNCDFFPIYFPIRRITRDTLWGHLLFLTPIFLILSYGGLFFKKYACPLIYVSLNEMSFFSKVVLPFIRYQFILVTGDSDRSSSDFRELLDNKYLVKWFAQNNDLDSERVNSIPIGLDYHTLIANSSFGERKKSAKMQEKELIKIKSKKIKQEMKVFANFHLSFTSGRKREIYEKLRENPIMYWQKKKMPRSKMWELQKRFAFNFSPVGNGLDCHRTWESLILGQIPIVERTGKEIDKLYEEFPIVLIDDLSEINEENLKKWYKKYSKKFTPEMERKLTNDYWIREIKDAENGFSGNFP